MSMIVDAIEAIELKARIPLLETLRGVYLYNDDEKRYRPLIPQLDRNISNIESLGAVIHEEVKRRGNSSGNFMTVILTEQGGIFYPDDQLRLDQWKFQRCLSQQWSYLVKNIDRELDHLSFLRVLQGLRPSIQNYATLMREFKKVTFDGKTTVTSQPIIENGNAGAEVSFTLETKNGQTQTAMPGEFELVMPFVKAGLKSYTFKLELDVSLDSNNKVCFRLVFPEREIIVETALNDELEYLTKETENLEDLLILLDY